ncbi:MAG: hypothetical protein L0191_11675, partial [Acidobacteria bacterium]|nr:hypothetical protein [Acidobacteriota bacterium]
MTDQEGADIATIRLPIETVESADSSLGGGLPRAAWSDAAPQVRADALPKAGIWIRMAAWIADVLFLFLPTVVAALVVW